MKRPASRGRYPHADRWGRAKLLAVGHSHRRRIRDLSSWERFCAAVASGIGAFYLITALLEWGDKMGVAWVSLQIVAALAAAGLFAVVWGAAFRFRKTIAGVLVVTLVAAAVGTFIVPGPTPATPQAAPSRSTTGEQHPPGPSTTTTPAAPEGCGAPAVVTDGPPEVEICVVYWCNGEVRSRITGEIDPTQIQYKIRPKIDNDDPDRPLNIALTAPSPLRLIVDSPLLPQHWDPPPITAAGGDTVLPFFEDGHQYWAVPPNANHEAYQVGDWYTGFATTWDDTEIAPSGVYFKKLRLSDDGVTNKQESDLVFQVPKNADGSDPHIIGLAYVSVTAEHTAVRRAMDSWPWPKSVQPSTF